MAPERKSFVNVDELMPRIGLEQVASYYGVPLPELHRIGQETRMRCFLHCGKEQETGARVLAVQENDPAKRWHCHEYGCGKGGNLVSLCDLLKGGESQDGRPRGERFKEIALDLRAMAYGAARADSPAIVSPAKPPPPKEPEVNVPLALSGNERARGLTELDYKFLRDVASMPPAASAYVRKRPFLSPEAMREWRVGYLPRDSGGDRSGGTMRGKIVYAYHSAEGNLLTWFGRDPGFEEKHREWKALGKSDHEPEKFHFVKGFHRGIELFGQHRLKDPKRAERLQQLGLIVVEGPNDVLRLDALGVPAVALCSNRITREQAERVAKLASEFADGIATILLDCDAEGQNGMKQALGYLAQLLPVRLAWTNRMYSGKFKERQPESLSEEEWREIEAYLSRGRTPHTVVTESAAKIQIEPESPETEPWDFI